MITFTIKKTSLHFFSVLLLLSSLSAYGQDNDQNKGQEAGQETKQDNVWLLINTQTLELEVKLADITLVKYKNISIGRNGSGFKRKRGDDTTPLGKYKISWINRKSRYNLFFGFNYPSIENVNTAFKKGLVDSKTYKKVIRAHKSNQVPPQNTPLGGLIGIHGLGRGDKLIHETMNWTHGCIALTNEQIHNLDTLVKKGTVVIVK